MRGAGKEAHQNTLVKGGRDHGKIMQMARPLPRVVGQVDIAFKDILTADPPDEMRQGIRHGIHMAGCPGDGLRQHPALHIIDPGRQIPRLPDRG